jgi:hypothetical protein
LHGDHLARRRLHRGDQGGQGNAPKVQDASCPEGGRYRSREATSEQEFCSGVTIGHCPAGTPNGDGFRVRIVLFLRRCARGRAVAVILAAALEETPSTKLSDDVERVASCIAVHQHAAGLIAITDHQRRVAVALAVAVRGHWTADQVRATGR